ncbi:MAG: ATP-binding cassette domain-containing protein [Litorivicinus sp.]
MGLVYVTEDRKHEGLIQSQTLGFNMTLSALQRFASATGQITERTQHQACQAFIERFAIKANSQQAIVSSLSGGNQQKVSIAKALMVNPKIVILDEPTRGVDVGAKREIYLLINELKSQGICVILMSSDMPELLGISDRIYVMAGGTTVAHFDRANATQEKILAASAGALSFGATA